MDAPAHKRLLERVVAATLRTAAWVVVSVIAGVLLLLVLLATIAATTYAKSLGVPPLLVDVPIVVLGLVVTVAAVREVRRLRRLYGALSDE